MTVQPVRGADGEDQSPLLKKCAIGREERVASVVDTGRFRGSAVEFNDLEIASLFEIFFIFVAEDKSMPSTKHADHPGLGLLPCEFHLQ